VHTSYARPAGREGDGKYDRQRDRMLSTMNINGADVMDLSFLKQLEEERKTKK
jgi:hypothetical protein